MSFSFGYLVCSVLIVAAIFYAKVVLSVLSVRLRTELTRERVEPGEVPPEVLGLLEAESAPLEALGFTPLAFVRTSSHICGTDRATWFRFLQHPVEKSFAILCPSHEPTLTRRSETLFMAQADAGRRLETAAFALGDDHADCAKHLRIVAQTPSLAEQWERHQREVAARPDYAPRDVSCDELFVELAEAYRCLIKAGLASGRFVPAGEGAVRSSLRTAIALAFTASRQAKRRRAALASAQPTDAAAPADVTAEVLEHHRRESVEASRAAGRLLKLGIFVASMVAMAVVFGLTLSLETALIILAVLLAHESGHALAMKAFGYSNVQMFFIPLFGAVAYGKKRNVAPWQELVVLLAGPLPGIVVGMLLYFLVPQRSGWLHDTTLVLLFLNYFNLLPILPLDGGQIVNLALFERFPRAQVVFGALSAVALVAWSGGSVLFVVGLAMLLTVPAQLRQARLLLNARARLSGAPEDPLNFLYLELRQAPHAKLNPDAKYLMVKGLMERLAQRPASGALACATLVGWLAIMALPLGVIRYRSGMTDEQELAEATADQDRRAADWAAKIAAAATPHDEVRLRLDAGEEFFEGLELKQARVELEPALPLLAKLGDPELEASVLLLQGQLEQLQPDATRASAEQIALAERHLNRALDLREQRFGIESLEVAEVLQAFPADPSRDRVGALVRQLRLIGIYERALADAAPEVRWLLVRAHQGEARLRDASGDPERAELALQNALAVADAAPEDERERMQIQALQELSGFYFASGRNADVRPLLEKRAAAAPDRIGETDRCWVAYWDGAPADSATCFAAAGDEIARHAGSEGAAEVGRLEYWLDEAAARSRAGNDAAARELLGRIRSTMETKFHQRLDLYLRMQSGIVSEDTFAGRESNRRKAERTRVLEPLLASLEVKP